MKNRIIVLLKKLEYFLTRKEVRVIYWNGRIIELDKHNTMIIRGQGTTSCTGIFIEYYNACFQYKTKVTIKDNNEAELTQEIVNIISKHATSK